MEDLFKVGVITSTHGLKGEVKVFPTTDDPKRFLDLKEILLDTGKEKTLLHISNVRFFKNMVILKFKGIDNINQIEKYRGKGLFIQREQAVKCEKDEYFKLMEFYRKFNEDKTAEKRIELLESTSQFKLQKQQEF